MEILTFVLILIVVSVIILILRPKKHQQTGHEPVKTAHLIRYDNEARDIWGQVDSAGKAEQYVTQELLSLGENYFIFQNVILPSAYNKIPYTEIDHIVVSAFGIFCIETKSHAGNIYGNKEADQWEQYLYNDKPYSLYNPLKQSYSHKESLKKFLGSNLKSNIHYYVVFPKAHIVKVNSTLVTYDIHEIMARISDHQTRIYDIDSLEVMLKLLAHYDSNHMVIKDKHIEGVRNYISSKNN